MQTSDTLETNSGSGKGLGVASLICGGVGLCVPFLAVVGFVLGLIGLMKAKPGQKVLPGVGMGVSGGTFLVNLLLMIAILLPAFAAARSTAEMIQQQQQLSQIGLAYMTYPVDHKGMFPDHAEDVLEYAVDGQAIFIAPGTDAATLPLTKLDPKPTEPYTYGSYEFMPLGGLFVELFVSPSKTVMAYSSSPAGPGGLFTLVLFANGHVEPLEQAEFERVLQDTLDEIESLQRR